MDKISKKLTDRELIDVVVSWYKLDQSTEDLRNAVSLYLQRTPTVVPIVVEAISFEEPGVESGPDAIALQDTNQNQSTLIVPVDKPAIANAVSSEVTYTQQFEPTDELIGSRGRIIDAWALYYGVEECFYRISFGLLNMHTLAFLFCILISIAVVIGAWQSNLSTERQKKATFKSMVIEPPNQSPENPAVPDLDSVIEPNKSLSAAEPIEASPTPIVNSTSNESSAATYAETPFTPAVRLMEKASWDEALANLQTLEVKGDSDREPLLTLLRIEVLIQKHDAESMELARQLLMDCKWGEFNLVYDLLVARWMLFGSLDDRKRFLNEAASLPDTARRRMSTWAHVRNGSKDAMNEVSLESYASKGQSEVCDQLFMSLFHYTMGKFDVTVRELLDTKKKLRALHAYGKTDVENWLLETSMSQLTSKVDDLLTLARRQTRKEIN